MATEIWVKPGGSGDGTSYANAYGTIAVAVADIAAASSPITINVDSGDYTESVRIYGTAISGKTVTIQKDPVNATTNPVLLAGAGGVLPLQMTTAGESQAVVNLVNLNIDTTGGAVNVRNLYIYVETISVNCTGCVFSCDGNTNDNNYATIWINKDNPSAEHTFTDCTFADVPRYAITTNGKQCKSIVLDNCTITRKAAAATLPAFYLNDVIEYFRLKDSDYTGNGAHNVVKLESGCGGVNGARNLIQIDGNTMTCPSIISAYEGTGDATTAMNFTIDDNTITANSGKAIVNIGIDRANISDNFQGAVRVRRNSIECNADRTMAHMFLIGGGCRDTIIEYNLIKDAITDDSNSYGIVDKSYNCTIRYNRIYGPRAVYLSGSTYSKVYNNTIYSSTVQEGGNAPWALCLGQSIPAHLNRPSLDPISATHVEGEVQAVPDTSHVTLEAGASSESEDYVNCYIIIHESGHTAQVKQITAYDTVTKIATIDGTWDWTPTSTPGTDNYYITTPPIGNEVYNNILIADGTNGAGNVEALRITGSYGAPDLWCDYNLYCVVNSGVLAYLDGAELNTLASIQSEWASTWTNAYASPAGVYASNDANSAASTVLAIEDLATNDFRPTIATETVLYIAGLPGIGAIPDRRRLTFSSGYVIGSLALR